MTSYFEYNIKNELFIFVLVEIVTYMYMFLLPKLVQLHVQSLV